MVPGNRHDPRLLREQPCQRNLRLGRLLLVGNLSERIDERRIRFSGFCGEARNDVAEVRLVELRLVGDCSCKEALTQRTEGDEPDTEFLQC